MITPNFDALIVDILRPFLIDSQDAFAILLAAFHPHSRLLGISTVSGNASLEHTTHNALAIAAAIGIDHDVITGADRPLTRPASFAPTIHGATGLDGVPLLPSVPKSMTRTRPSGVEHIAKAVLAEPANTVWLIATGPLTNIAQLFRDFPDAKSHVYGLSVMGGAIGEVPNSQQDGTSSAPSMEPFTAAPPHRKDGKGNWTAYAEFNIWCDPEAAAEVFETLKVLDKPVILIPLDLTHQVRGTTEVQELLFSAPSAVNGVSNGTATSKNAGPSKIRQMFKQVMLYFADTYSQHSGIHDGPPLHDPLAVYAVLEPDAFDDRGWERWDVKVDCSEGERAGETVAVPSDRQGHGVKIPRAVELTRFWSSIDKALAGAERKAPFGRGNEK